jgi:hypothetical protein
MPRKPGEWHPEARELRAQGWALRRIAKRLKVSHVAVWLACDAEAAQRDRERSRAYINANRAEHLARSKAYYARKRARIAAVAREYGAS